MNMIKESIISVRDQFQLDMTNLLEKMKIQELERSELEESIDKLQECSKLPVYEKGKRGSDETEVPTRRTHIDDMMRVIEGVSENRGEDLLGLKLDISDYLDIRLYIKKSKPPGMTQRVQKPWKLSEKRKDQ